jgi:hypothetical protein
MSAPTAIADAVMTDGVLVSTEISTSKLARIAVHNGDHTLKLFVFTDFRSAGTCGLPPDINNVRRLQLTMDCTAKERFIKGDFESGRAAKLTAGPHQKMSQA